jgi:hypothetical protein
MKLLVYWGFDDAADLQIPKEVKWEDGTPATLEDYYRNESATQTDKQTEDGLVTVLFPDVIAVTRYDTARGCWILEDPEAGDPMILEITDPNATDELLKHHLSSYPVAYKSTFDRSHLVLDGAMRR